jgi:hypothetical protein
MAKGIARRRRRRESPVWMGKNLKRLANTALRRAGWSDAKRTALWIELRAEKKAAMSPLAESYRVPSRQFIVTYLRQSHEFFVLGNELPPRDKVRGAPGDLEIDLYSQDTEGVRNDISAATRWLLRGLSRLDGLRRNGESKEAHGREA